MGGRDVYKILRRAFARGHCYMRLSVPLCIQGRLKGRLQVRMCGVHVVDDV